MDQMKHTSLFNFMKAKCQIDKRIYLNYVLLTCHIEDKNDTVTMVIDLLILSLIALEVSSNIMV